MNKPYYENEHGKLFLGDCLTVMQELIAEGVKVDACITDPPYFQPATHYCPTRTEGKPKKSIGDMSILESFFKIFISGAMNLLRDDGSAYLFCDGQSYPLAFVGLYPFAKAVRPLIWDKITSYNGYTWRHQHELIAWAEFEETPRIPTGDGDNLRFKAMPVGEREHPAQKPIDLLNALIAKTKKAGTILDPFAGSGTTLVAAQSLGRKWVGIEISEDYCKIAVKRLEGTIRQIEGQQTFFNSNANPPKGRFK